MWWWTSESPVRNPTPGCKLLKIHKNQTLSPQNLKYCYPKRPGRAISMLFLMTLNQISDTVTMYFSKSVGGVEWLKKVMA
jgi:hypothetical protein